MNIACWRRRRKNKSEWKSLIYYKQFSRSLGILSHNTECYWRGKNDIWILEGCQFSIDLWWIQEVNYLKLIPSTSHCVRQNVAQWYSSVTLLIFQWLQFNSSLIIYLTFINGLGSRDEDVMLHYLNSCYIIVTPFDTSPPSRYIAY